MCPTLQFQLVFNEQFRSCVKNRELIQCSMLPKKNIFPIGLKEKELACD
jgi:hypothetical protein